MTHILALASFLVFVALGVRIRRTAGWDARRRAVNALLRYVLGLSGVVAVSQWDDWPFTSHTIAVGRPRLDAPVCMTEFRGVDAQGREWRIDPYSWSEVYDSILQYWFKENAGRLSRRERQRVLGFLLGKAEASRARLARGDRIGYERLLGRAACPYWWLLPRQKAIPDTPYVGLRAYGVCWRPLERLRDPGSRTETLQAEYVP